MLLYAGQITCAYAHDCMPACQWTEALAAAAAARAIKQDMLTHAALLARLLPDRHDFSAGVGLVAADRARHAHYIWLCRSTCFTNWDWWAVCCSSSRERAASAVSPVCRYSWMMRDEDSLKPCTHDHTDIILPGCRQLQLQLRLPLAVSLMTAV